MNKEKTPAQSQEGKKAGQLGQKDMEKLLKAREAYGKAGQWQGQLNEISRLYPDMDIKEALAKPEIRQLLKAGVDFKTAFEAANMEEIRRYIELDAERRAIERLESNSQRAVENGIAASKSAPFAAGAKGLSKSDRDEIVKRVLMGEEIRL